MLNDATFPVGLGPLGGVTWYRRAGMQWLHARLGRIKFARLTLRHTRPVGQCCVCMPRIMLVSTPLNRRVGFFLLESQSHPLVSPLSPPLFFVSFFPFPFFPFFSPLSNPGVGHCSMTVELECTSLIRKMALR